MNGVEVTIPRGARHEIRATRSPGEGIIIREWFRASDGQMRPGREGMRLSLREWDRLIEGLGSAPTSTPARPDPAAIASNV